MPTGLDCFLYILVLECVDIEGPFQYSSQNMNWRLSSQWVPKCQENNGNIFLNIQCRFNALCEMGYQSEFSLWQGGTWEEGISVLFFKLYIYWRKIPLVSLHPAATVRMGASPNILKIYVAIFTLIADGIRWWSFGEVMGSWNGGRPHEWISSLVRKASGGSWAFCQGRTQWGTGSLQPEEGLRQNRTTLAPDPGPQPPELWEVHFYGL